MKNCAIPRLQHVSTRARHSTWIFVNHSKTWKFRAVIVHIVRLQCGSVVQILVVALFCNEKRAQHTVPLITVYEYSVPTGHAVCLRARSRTSHSHSHSNGLEWDGTDRKAHGVEATRRNEENTHTRTETCAGVCGRPITWYAHTDASIYDHSFISTYKMSPIKNDSAPGDKRITEVYPCSVLCTVALPIQYRQIHRRTRSYSYS